MFKIIGLTLSLILFSAIFIYAINIISQDRISGAPPDGASREESPENPYSWAQNWQRPNVTAKVALQVGHWKNNEFPEELARLRNNTGASGGGKTEIEVNLAIAEETAQILQSQGISVEILPATIPPRYWADVFIAIHADGSEDLQKRGFKVAGPWHDFTGSADNLVQIIKANYSKDTGFLWDDNITRNMRGYYAFSWWKFEHSLHPMTTAVILETGFLSNHQDRLTIVNNPQIPAQAIANSINQYLQAHNLM